jgi:orotidine-5'-phosphate decarboxylase
MTYTEKLKQRLASTGSNLCVGLDIRADEPTERTKQLLIRIVEETLPFAAAFKPNSAYFEAMGWKGMRLLSQVLKAVPKEVPIILDFKRGDIGETQSYYAKAAFEVAGVDAVTLSPYMGAESFEPFLKFEDKGIYLLGVTSNAGAADLQLQRLADGRFVFECVAQMAASHAQCGLVLGLTQANADILQRIPDVPLLVPGLGAQGGEIRSLCCTGRRAPLLVNVSRGILYQEDGLSYAQRAEKWQRTIAENLS